KIQDQIDPDLETICLKCLEKEPERRYGSAAALADDLDRWLRHEPIQARPSSTWEKGRKWMHRNPAIAGLAGAVALVFLLGFAGVLWALAKSHASLKEAKYNLYAANIRLAAQKWEQGHLAEAKTNLIELGPKAGEEDLRGFEWRYLWNQCRD